MQPSDVLVIGGGINGCGIARDAVGRGYSVVLAEQSDLASGTSSWSTKLIHGGLRYLEHYEFRLVREALKERDVLWRMAPHIIWPLRFVLPHHDGLRPAWLLRFGLFLYDHLGNSQLPKTVSVDLTKDAAGKPLKPCFTKGFEYSDCWVMDSRLVVLNARDAANRGAEIFTRTECTMLRREGAFWTATLKDIRTGQSRNISARFVVNAAGPWVDDVLRRVLGRNKTRNIRLVQGSHIVVRKLYAHERCYILQNTDGRIVFAIPYEADYTLIGTTDHDYGGDPAHVKITEGEIDYLLAAAGEYFQRPIDRSEIVWSYSGVRPLFNDGASKAQEATRDYVLKVDGEEGEAPIVNIFGGKITTFRRLAEAVLEKVEAALGARGPSWTATASLPGGDFPLRGFDNLVKGFEAAHPGVSQPLISRLVRLYGTKAATILGSAQSDTELGRDFGAGLTEAEVNYLRDQEWARSAEDVLWRRSKLGLKLRGERVTALDDYLNSTAERQPVDASNEIKA